MVSLKKLKKKIKKLASPLQKAASSVIVKSSPVLGGFNPALGAVSTTKTIAGTKKTVQLVDKIGKNAAYAIPVFAGNLALPVQALGSAFGGKKLQTQMKNLFIAQGAGAVLAVTAGAAAGAFPAGTLPALAGGETLALAGAGAGAIGAGAAAAASGKIAQIFAGDNPKSATPTPTTPPGEEKQGPPASMLSGYLPWILVGGVVLFVLFTAPQKR